MTRVALLEVLDREGQPRQTHVVTGWPLTIGRAFDNDVVLSDPHVAARHLTISEGEEGLELAVGESANGLHWGHQRLHAGERRALAADGPAPEWTVGRTRLLLRLPGHALAPELPLAAAPPLARRVGPTAAVALALFLVFAFSTWLDSDPDTFGRALGSTLMSAVLGTAAWCGAWAMLSKIFTRASRFGWHLLVFLGAALLWTVLDAALALTAFALSWTWVTDFAFVVAYGVAAATLYFHLLAVEPQRPRLLRGVAATAFAVGVGLSLWFNHQREDRLGAELYMSHLFPPALRVARPVPTDRFIDGLGTLRPVLEKKAKEPPFGDGGAGGGDEE